MIRILPVVEGDGDLAAVPELMRRVLHEAGHFGINLGRPHKRGDLPKVLARFDDYFRVAILEGAAIFWVMDYDCDTCIDQTRDLRLLRAHAACVDTSVDVEFVFMVKEYESLFLADHETTRRVFTDIPASFAFPNHPEAVRDAKGALSKARPKGSAYKSTQHQKTLTAQVNLTRLRERSLSYRNFEAALLRLSSGHARQIKA